MNQEIVKKTKREYVCGNLHCGKKYGTNAALYTHIKNKHQGITPHGTIRPPLESIKGRKGRPTSTKIDSQQQDDTINERINIVKIMSNPQFQEFIYLIGSIGDNNIIRDQDEQYEYITINELNNIQMDCFGECNKLKEQHINYLIQSSPFWKPELFYDLHYYFIYALGNGSFQGIFLFNFLR